LRLVQLAVAALLVVLLIIALDVVTRAVGDFFSLFQQRTQVGSPFDVRFYIVIIAVAMVAVVALAVFRWYVPTAISSQEGI